MPSVERGQVGTLRRGRSGEQRIGEADAVGRAVVAPEEAANSGNLRGDVENPEEADEIAERRLTAAFV